ncbi:MAG TPA: hypothetical protein VHQ90_21915 [Thermoanaerobaculia bacterium]|nr:hypothetical protein [Thermoanaerobaculia bacterium]
MPRPRIRHDRPLSSTERVQRFRSRCSRDHHRLEVLLDLATIQQVARFGRLWGCSMQEVLKITFQACSPAMQETASARDVFNQVREGLALLHRRTP